MLRITFSFLLMFISLASMAQIFQENYLELKGHKTTVNAVSFSTDGKILYAAGGKNQVIAWNISTQEIIFQTDEEANIISYLGLNSDNSYLATGGFANGKISIYDANSGIFLRTIDTQDSYLSALTFSKINPALLATASVNGSDQIVVKFWDITTGTLLQTSNSQCMNSF